MPVVVSAVDFNLAVLFDPFFGVLKRRSDIVLKMRILQEIKEEPRGPTRLAQATNLSFDKCIPYLQGLEQRGLIRRDNQEGHDIYSITQEGNDAYLKWQELWEKLGP